QAAPRRHRRPRAGVTDSGLVSLLIPAVGGQGGGVLSEWIVEAAALDGYRAHGTSIPGVAQRTGSTTYYVELVTDRDATEDPAFSLYPVPGALDVLLAPEFLEVGRMIEAGFVSPARTTVVCSTHRLYTIHEKTATGGAIYPRERLDALAPPTQRRACDSVGSGVTSPPTWGHYPMRSGESSSTPSPGSSTIRTRPTRAGISRASGRSPRARPSAPSSRAIWRRG